MRDFSTFADCEAPSTTVTTNKEELLLYFKQMYTMRRMEIVNDTEYKVQNKIITCNKPP